MLLAAWLPACAITVLHYATGAEHHWLHDVLRRLYYLPILFAAFACGLRGGLVLAAVVALAYSPHAFTHVAHHDPADTLEKALELLLYLVVGVVAGLLVDRERSKQLELTATAEKLRQALEEQRRTADQLVRAGRLAALGELVAGIAHEIKNPLHSLRGTAEVVDGVVPSEAPERRMWELHRREIDRLEAVAERFLSFARPSPLERRSVDLAPVLERTRALIASQARQREVEVIVDASGVAALVEADEQQLIQVLLNISINALQALSPGGTIRFALGEERRGAACFRRITVSNDGPQIPEAELERIFDPFFTTKSDGVGLGLSIAARIVEQHGGTIRVVNLPGGGVAFVIALPCE
jgi:two-component system, NtrC family, sensor histidine kinase HydH